MLYEHISFYRIQQKGKIVTQQYHCPHAILVPNHTVLSSNLPSNLYKNTVNFKHIRFRTHPSSGSLSPNPNIHKNNATKKISFFIFFRMSNPCPLPPTHVSVPPPKGGGEPCAGGHKTRARLRALDYWVAWAT